MVGQPGRQLAPAPPLLCRRTAGRWPWWALAAGRRLLQQGFLGRGGDLRRWEHGPGRGWQTFARARGLGRRCTLHFQYDGDATLYMRVFGEDGRRVGCFPEDDDGDVVLGLGDGPDEGEGDLAAGVLD